MSSAFAGSSLSGLCRLEFLVSLKLMGVGEELGKRGSREGTVGISLFFLVPSSPYTSLPNERKRREIEKDERNTMENKAGLKENSLE